MPLIYDPSGSLYRPHTFRTEAEFEKQVVALADQIFGPSTIYVDVKKKINAEISVLEMRAFRDDTGAFLYEFDTLYDEDDEPVVPQKPGEKPPPASLPGYRAAMLARRAVSDTVVVPAHQDGFEREFLGNHQWYAIRLSAAMRDRLKYIAAYQVSPVSAVTHIAEIASIEPYQDTGKFKLTFKGAPQAIGPVTTGNTNYSLQGPIYVQREKLLAAKTLEDVLTVWRKPGND